jgi:hypothetical protein
MWTWRLGNGDLTIGQFAPHNLTKWTWQNTKLKVAKHANRKIAMWISNFGKENKNRLQLNLAKCLNQRYLLDGYLIFWDNHLEFLLNIKEKNCLWSGLLKRVSGGYEPTARIVPVACDAGYTSRFSNKYPPKLQSGGFWCHLNNDPQNGCWTHSPAITALEAEHTKKTSTTSVLN